MSVSVTRPRGRRRRQGTAYIAVLGAATIVTIIGLSALVIARLQRRMAGRTNDFAEARLYALSGVDMGLLQIKKNPGSWRSDFAVGSLPTDRPIGRGTFSVVAADPVDGDLTNNSTDPVLLTGIGYAGQARYKLQVRLESTGAPTPGTWRQVVD
ncbi:MAG: hypothetical protein AMJ81_12455 [Phycisphaerae bacterium SM23_33]|nr:MAG: hypothetical protein AMJ81_12455 [Phycisphaerae bacterium SM23_33]